LPLELFRAWKKLPLPPQGGKAVAALIP
jgi:hypothetical protein